ncbi:MAG TPA: cupin domain-containing protein [Burkholderiales bacterium]|nr:cupin domain-containing protein [Burkholderiales bacterium]
MKVVAHLLAPQGAVPNHPRWPLLVYAGVFDEPTAEDFEALFTRNGWPAAWRNGVFAYHHYHPDGHEVLGVYSGEVTVLFGGEGGVALTARPGDAIVLPAGTGHKQLSSRGRLGVVGAYPEGRHPQTSIAATADAAKNAALIARVPLPSSDPVRGPRGPLFEHWPR